MNGQNHAMTRGITLIELLIVIAIISIAAAMVIGGIYHTPRAIKTTQTHNALAILADALDAYLMDSGRLPANRSLDLFENGRILAALTTPIPYLEYLPEAPLHSAESGFPFGYWNLEGNARSEEIPSGTLALLLERGWNQQLDSDITTAAIRLSPYDPTNGTLSAGDLILPFPIR